MLSMKGKRFVSVPVLAVILLMVFVYYCSMFVFLQDWLGLQSSPGTLNAFLFSLFASLSLFSFFSCVLTDPGHVPSSYAPDVEFSKDVIFFHISIMGLCLINHSVYTFCFGKWSGFLSVWLLVSLMWIKVGNWTEILCIVNGSMLQVFHFSCYAWLLNNLWCLNYSCLHFIQHTHTYIHIFLVGDPTLTTSDMANMVYISVGGNSHFMS